MIQLSLHDQEVVTAHPEVILAEAPVLLWARTLRQPVFLSKLVRSIPATDRCRGKEPESQFCAHLLPEAVSGAAAAPLGAVGGAIASAAWILVSFW